VVISLTDKQKTKITAYVGEICAIVGRKYASQTVREQVFSFVPFVVRRYDIMASKKPQKPRKPTYPATATVQNLSNYEKLFLEYQKASDAFPELLKQYEAEYDALWDKLVNQVLGMFFMRECSNSERLKGKLIEISQGGL